MRRIIAAFAGLITVLGVLLGAVTIPASANHGTLPSHWGQYRWGGIPYGFRAFYVYDHSGNGTVGAALQEFTSAFNNDAERRGYRGIVPIMIYVSRPEYTGQCNGVTSLPGYSFTTVCAGRPASVCGVSPPVGSSVTCTASGHNGEPFHPYTWIQRDYPDYNTTFSHVAHELLHQIGLNHTTDSGALMYGSLPLGQKRYLSEHDWQAVIAVYTSHPVATD